MRAVSNFLRDELGADLTESMLIVAFVAIGGAAVYLGAGSSVGSVWTTANLQITGSISSGAGSPANSNSWVGRRWQPGLSR